MFYENNGTLDKYIGDAIVAFYGAPIEVANHGAAGMQNGYKDARKSGDFKTRMARRR